MIQSYQKIEVSGLYYKLMTIVNDDSGAVNKLEASLTDDARVVIYDRRMFIVEATAFKNNLHLHKSWQNFKSLTFVKILFKNTFEEQVDYKWHLLITAQLQCEGHCILLLK